MKKKTYEQPQLSIIEVKSADIICTSGGLNGDFQINGGNGIELGEEEWGTL